jgi:hypothetical protein
MNTSDNRCFGKRTISNAQNLTGCIPVVFKAALGFRFVGMTSPTKKRSSFPDERGTLFGFSSLGSHRTKTSLTNLFAGFLGSRIAARRPKMTITEMFFRSKPFKVAGSVIRFVMVDMVNMARVVWVFKPANSNDAVHKVFTAAAGKVSILSLLGAVRLHLSKNFSTVRDCVKMVKDSVLDSFYRDAYHAVSS